MKLLRFNKTALFILLAGFSALLSIVVVFSLINGAPAQIIKASDARTFNVDKGDSVNAIISRLENDGLVENGVFLKAYLKLNKGIFTPKIGHYEIAVGMTLADFLQLTSDGKEKLYTVTMVEGLTWKQWAAQLAQSEFIVNDASAEDIIAELGLQPESLEGVLLPETYKIRFGTPLSEFVKRLHADMQTYLHKAWDNRQGLLPIKTPYEALILASIIEKETGVAAERPRIAGVFINRLNTGMRLQTDPTVIYGMGERFDGDIRRKDLREKTPYNTYVIKGLPPTPIAMPGKAAIDAALNPEATQELYFVSKGDGSHQFSQTLEEHNRAVRKYQLGK